MPMHMHALISQYVKDDPLFISWQTALMFSGNAASFGSLHEIHPVAYAVHG